MDFEIRRKNQTDEDYSATFIDHIANSVLSRTLFHLQKRNQNKKITNRV